MQNLPRCNAKPKSIPTINPERIAVGSIKVSRSYFIFISIFHSLAPVLSTFKT